MKPVSFVALVVLGFVTAGCSDPAPMRVAFTPYTPEALAAAKAENKPAVLFATADWCGPCQRLRGGAFSDAKVTTALESFVRLKIDGTNEDDPALRANIDRFKIRGYPTVIFFDRNGVEVTRLGRAEPAEVVLAAADKANPVN